MRPPFIFILIWLKLKMSPPLSTRTITQFQSFCEVNAILIERKITQEYGGEGIYLISNLNNISFVIC